MPTTEEHPAGAKASSSTDFLRGELSGLLQRARMGKFANFAAQKFSAQVAAKNDQTQANNTPAYLPIQKAEWLRQRNDEAAAQAADGALSVEKETLARAIVDAVERSPLSYADRSTIFSAIYLGAKESKC